LTKTVKRRRRIPKRPPFEIGGASVSAGERTIVELPFGALSTHSPMALPVQVVHGRRDGPTLFVSAAIHGDEVNGVEIIRRLLSVPSLRNLRGTLLAVPIVNLHGFIAHERYLPDRRDLNRSFPGSESGSLASRLAHLFMNEVVARCSHGIDLHTGAYHRFNLPQVRAHLDDAETETLARRFGAPVVLASRLRDGSLRQAAMERGIKLLLYEAGEALRFDETAIRAGLRGIINVMHAIDMLPGRAARVRTEPVVVGSSRWTRAPASGLLRITARIGHYFSAGDVLGMVSDPFGETEREVTVQEDGILIGRTNLPVVNQGDALFHIAKIADQDAAEEAVEQFREEVEKIELLDEPPIV